MQLVSVGERYTVTPAQKRQIIKPKKPTRVGKTIRPGSCINDPWTKFTENLPQFHFSQKDFGFPAILSYKAIKQSMPRNLSESPFDSKNEQINQSIDQLNGQRLLRMKGGPFF
jgi:hypothetical protein